MDLPWASWAPYAAMRFHLALPELNGLGVMTVTPVFTRSAPGRDVLGISLPDDERDDGVGDAAHRSAPLFQLGATRPALTNLVMSGVSGTMYVGEGNPSTTAVDCDPDAPKDWVKVTPFPALVAWKAVMRAA